MEQENERLRLRLDELQSAADQNRSLKASLISFIRIRFFSRTISKRSFFLFQNVSIKVRLYTGFRWMIAFASLTGLDRFPIETIELTK